MIAPSYDTCILVDMSTRTKRIDASVDHSKMKEESRLGIVT
jgi:hypothetical protein